MTNMSMNFNRTLSASFAASAFVAWMGVAPALAAEAPAAPAAAKVSSFASSVDLGPLFRTAVQADGRLRSFESHAKTYMGYVAGSRPLKDQSFGFTYLDMIFRATDYIDRPIIYVKNKDFLGQLLQVMVEVKEIQPAEADAYLKTRLLPPSLFSHPAVRSRMDELSRDVIRTEKPVSQLRGALNVAQPALLLQELRFVAPPTGERNDPWIAMRDLAATAPRDSAHAGMARSMVPAGLDPELAGSISDTWAKLGAAWRGEDAAAVNVQIARLAELVRQVSPELHPSPGRLGLESWYFRWYGMTWVWLIYLASIVPLLMSVIYKWNGARRVGMGIFFLAIAAHTASVIIRWIVSGRWPNTNMFEAVTTAAWFGSVLALVLEFAARKSLMRNLFALGAAIGSMVALMIAYFAPTGMDSAISNKMAALDDVWLYIHTNVIIASYALIFMGGVSALLYMAYRWGRAWALKAINPVRLMILPVAMAICGYAGYVLLMHIVSPTHRLPIEKMWAVIAVIFFSGLVLVLEMFSAKARGRAGMAIEHAAAGGAGTLMAAGAQRPGFIRLAPPTLGQVFDGATMVLMELSFIMLWAGLVMGAIWADHTWGRPWGWDPKEVFALNTFIIIIALIHVRLKVRDKGLWTAVLALAGCAVMLFNWIVINFIIVGLHSYA
jgi:ABC-type transport system involved in cytochrome c biogenesis permease subunit